MDLSSLDMTSLLWGLLFGSIGMIYFVYGRKQGRPVPLISGIALMVFPYVVSNSIAIVLIGILLMVVPYFIRY